MKKIVFLSALFLLLAGTIKAQQLKGLSATELSKIKSSVTKDGSFKARQNAVTTNGIAKLAVNRENAGKIDTYFSNKVKTKGILTKNHQVAVGYSLDLILFVHK